MPSVGPPFMVPNLNNFVTFDPDPSTYRTTSDTTGCPAGCVGKFSFDANLANISDSVLSNLLVEVNELTNDNLLLTDKGLIGKGEWFEVPKNGDYADGELSQGEDVYVPFTVCLKKRKPFRLFVVVLGTASGIPNINPPTVTGFDLGADPEASVQSGGGSSGGCFIATGFCCR